MSMVYSHIWMWQNSFKCQPSHIFVRTKLYNHPSTWLVECAIFFNSNRLSFFLLWSNIVLATYYSLNRPFNVNQLSKILNRWMRNGIKCDVKYFQTDKEDARFSFSLGLYSISWAQRWQTQAIRKRGMFIANLWKVLIHYRMCVCVCSFLFFYQMTLFSTLESICYFFFVFFPLP